VASLQYLNEVLENSSVVENFLCVIANAFVLNGHLGEEQVGLTGFDNVRTRHQIAKHNCCSVSDLAWVAAV